MNQRINSEQAENAGVSLILAIAQSIRPGCRLHVDSGLLKKLRPGFWCVSLVGLLGVALGDLGKGFNDRA